MNRIVFTLGIWLFPAACTALGAAGVFLLRRQARPATRRILCGMAAGIMLAASVWSLLLPAIARSQGRAAWVPPALGLILGAVGLLRLEDAAGQLLAGGPGHCGRDIKETSIVTKAAYQRETFFLYPINKCTCREVSICNYEG